MALQNSYSSYKETQIKTASPVDLIILLYDGMLKNLRKGEAGLQDGDRRRAGRAARSSTLGGSRTSGARFARRVPSAADQAECT